MFGGGSITFQYRYRKQLLIGGISILILSIGIFFLIKNLPKKKSLEPIKTTSLKKEKEVQNVDDEVHFKVDIKGEIMNPGIYSLVENSRVIDVINMAGGLTENADTTVLNLSKKIKDEMVIIVYSREEVDHFKETKQIEAQVEEQCINGNYSVKNDACIEENETSGNLININVAGYEELMSLSGIGESKAKDIIKYREENGPFQTIEDIMNVNGIGENIYSQIKENITV